MQCTHLGEPLAGAGRAVVRPSVVGMPGRGAAGGVGLLVGWPYGMWACLAVGLAAGGLAYSFPPNAFSLRDPMPWAAGVLGWRGLLA